jgi:hypothetical protein
MTAGSIPTEDEEVAAPAILDLLSPVERRELAAIVATNGGGLDTHSATRARLRVWLRLHLMGLAQGMSGRPWRVVHTKAGLAVARAMPTGARP